MKTSGGHRVRNEILLVEADAVIRRWVKAALTPLEMRVSPADPAAASLHGTVPALIVVGPGVATRERLDIIEWMDRPGPMQHVPVLFLTSEALPASWYGTGGSHPSMDSLAMPVAPEALRARVSLFLEMRKVHTDLEAERRQRIVLEGKLQEAEQCLRTLTARVNGIREAERARIAREIHDELGQVLTGLRMDVAWLARRFGDLSATLSEKTTSMKALIDSTVHLVQRISSGLRPELVDQIGLVASIRMQGDEFCKRFGIRCRCDLPRGEDESLPRDVAYAVFRTFQELMTNIGRHARAGRVEVLLRFEPDRVLLEVTDDGVGIPPDRLNDPRSLGLAGIRERATMLGGSFVIDGRKGTRGRFSLPRAGVTPPLRSSTAVVR